MSAGSVSANNRFVPAMFCTGCRRHAMLTCTRHEMFTLHVYHQSVLPGGERVTGEEAAKPVTAAQVCVSTFVTVTTLGTFKETSGQFPVMFEVTKAGVFVDTSRSLQMCLWQPK